MRCNAEPVRGPAVRACPERYRPPPTSWADEAPRKRRQDHLVPFGFWKGCVSAGRLAGGGVLVLVGGAVFKTVERQSLSLVGSIPIRLRYLRACWDGATNRAYSAL